MLTLLDLQARRRWRIRLGVIGVFWLVLTVASTLVYRAVWRGEGGGAGSGGGGESAALKLACNALQVLGAPVWYALWRLTGHTSSWALAICGSVGTWTAWAAACALLLVLRDYWLARRSALAPVEPAPIHAFMPTPSARPALPAVPDPLRRRLLFDIPAVGLILAGAGMCGAATLVNPWRVEVRRYRVRVVNMAREFEGFRIVQISDTHLGPRVPEPYLRDVVAQALDLRPDLIVLTGDYVHMGASYSSAAAGIFAPIVAAVDKHEKGGVGGLIGVAGVLGNHDHYAGAKHVTGDMQGVGVPMIDNDRLFVDLANRRLVAESPAGPSLAIAGLGDFQHVSANPQRAFRGVPPTTPRIVLAHNPDSAEAPQLLNPNGTAACRVDLMLSGHTHGGQVALPFVGPLVTFSRHWKKYAHGLNHGPLGPIITSAGIGMSVFPVRWGVPPELVEITLTCA